MRVLYIFLSVLFVLPEFGAAISPTVGPALTVQATSIAFGTVPRGAQRVSMLTIQLEASCNTGDANVESITVHHAGLGLRSDLQNLYLLEQGNRLTRALRISNSEGSVRFVLRNFVIQSCTKRTIVVAVDISPDALATSQHQLSIKQSSDIVLRQGTVTLSSASASGSAMVASRSSGVITVTMLPLTGRITYGDDRTVARLQLHADGQSNHSISAITLTNDGTAQNGDLQQLWLGNTRRERLSDITAQMDGEEARIVFRTPFLLEKNETLLLVLHANVRSGSSRTIRFIIEESSDIQASMQSRSNR